MKSNCNLFTHGKVLVFILSYSLVVCFLGCGRRNPDEESSPPAPGNVAQLPRVPAPNEAILFQPMFLWKEGPPTYQGTGFFAQGPDGKIAAVTSAHFLEMDGPALLEARWLNVVTGEPLATFTQSWGQPGHSGTTGPVMDLRSDYLLMPAPDSVPAEFVLILDPRLRADINERIWFPNKDPNVKVGFRLMTGLVVESDDKFCMITLDQDIALQSQSGTPFISQVTGKVIGTLSGAKTQKGKPKLLVTPSKAILDALTAGKDFPPLHSVIGK